MPARCPSFACREHFQRETDMIFHLMGVHHYTINDAAQAAKSSFEKLMPVAS